MKLGFPPCLGLILLAANLPARADDAELATKSMKILETYCYTCHGKSGRVVKKLDVLDVKKMIAGNHLKKGEPGQSKILTKIVAGEMPPETDDEDQSPNSKTLPKPRPDEVATLKQWIAAGAPEPTLASPRPSRTFISETEILKSIANDLIGANVRSKPFYRYFTTTHLYNAGLPDKELLTYRYGLSKLVNSLSWGRRIAKPVPVDPHRTIFRIDLRDLNWTEATWQAILKQYPYGITQNDPVARSIYEGTKSDLPYLRADWFVFAASKPPLYHEILGIPPTALELEQYLGVDVGNNLRTERVVRAAFTGSAVSHNNRMIERHESSYGAYWKSYDFGGNIGKQNVLTHPLGPGNHERYFKHDGGEFIFNLPNGLQAYMLVTADGKRIDRGPTNIVLDKNQPDSAVVNGVSCMNCHDKGMKGVADQVRPLAEQPNVFAKEEAETIKAVYPPKAVFEGLLKEDSDRFAKAMEGAGVPLNEPDPVFILARQFENPLDTVRAAAEVGLPTEEFVKRLRGSRRLLESLASLLLEAGDVKRDTFVATFSSAVADLRLGQWLAPAASAPTNIAPNAVAGPTPVVVPEAYRSLFNGKDLTGWTIDGETRDGWSVEDGAIVARGNGAKTRNYLLTSKDYGDFTLRLEFNLGASAGAGIAIRGYPGEHLPMANRITIFDHPLFKLTDSKPTEPTGTSYWVLDQIHVKPEIPARMNPPGQWNSLTVEVRGRNMQAWVNGKQLKTLNLNQASRFPDGTIPALNRPGGRIGLQKHTGTVSFRKLEVMELSASPMTAPTTSATPENNTMAIRALVDRGLVFVGAEEPEKAIAEFDEAIRLDPANAQAHAGRAFAYGIGPARDNLRGLAEADEALRLNPRSALAHAARGNFLLRPNSGKDLAGALSECDEATRLEPNLALVHSVKAEVYLRRFNTESHLAADLDLAIGECTTALKLDPKLTRAFLQRGQAKAMKGRPDPALVDFDAALRLSPRNAPAMRSRAGIWQEKKDYTRAIDEFSRAIAIDPKNFNSYQSRGDCFAAMNMRVKAKADHDEAERLKRLNTP